MNIDLAASIAELRKKNLDPAHVEAFLQELERAQAADPALIEVADQYDRLNGVLDGLAAAVDEFRGLGAAALSDRQQLMQAARTRFSIQLSALLADEGMPLDTATGAPLSSSMCRFRDNLRAVATRMAALVEQTIVDSSLRKELELAGAVQGMLVSSADGARFSDLRAYCWYQPAEQCAGDLWSIDAIGEGDVFTLLGDATGHGAPAALVAAVVKGACDLARLGMRSALQPFQLLRMLNRVLVESVRGEYLMTSIAVRYNAKDRSIAYANAGHGALWLVSEGQIRAVPGSGDPPLGARSVYRYEEQRMTLQPGDRIILFTDGIPESEGDDGQEFGERRLRQIVLDHEARGGTAILAAVKTQLEAHMNGRRALDDLTLVCLEFDPAPQGA